MVPTEEEALALAHDLEETLHAGDLIAANRLLDTGALVERVVAGLHAPQERLESFVDGLIVTLQEHAWFGAEVVEALERGGDYRLLRTFIADGERRVVYRLLTADGGLNYHEMVLERRGLAGPVRVADVYVYLTGERLSESYRRSFLGKDVGDDVASRVAEINGLIHNERFREAYARFAELPDSLQNDKTMLIKRLMITQDLDDELYVDAIESFRRLYPDEPALDLISLDGFVLRKQYRSALEVLDRLDARVGGDPYLDVQRAGLFLLQDDYDEAVRYAQSAVAADPFLQPGYWTLASIALETKDWDLLVRALDGLEDNFAVELRDLEEVPEYLEFLDSPEYEDWENSQEN
jgi:hypothetical protein